MSRGVVSKVSPVIAPVASGSQPVERSPPRNGRNVSPCSSGPRSSTEPSAAASVCLEPGVEVAAVRERAALDDAALVEPVEEEARAAAAAAPSRRGCAARPRCRPSARPAPCRCSRRRGSSTRRRSAPGTSRRAARPRSAAAAPRRRRAASSSSASQSPRRRGRASPVPEAIERLVSGSTPSSRA